MTWQVKGKIAPFLLACQCFDGEGCGTVRLLLDIRKKETWKKTMWNFLQFHGFRINIHTYIVSSTKPYDDDDVKSKLLSQYQVHFRINTYRVVWFLSYRSTEAWVKTYEKTWFDNGTTFSKAYTTGQLYSQHKCKVFHVKWCSFIGLTFGPRSCLKVYQYIFVDTALQGRLLG